MKVDHYNDHVEKDAKSLAIENIYNVTKCREDYINPTVGWELSCRIVKSYDTDFEGSLDRWKNKLYEVSTSQCT
jgi:hypothetical protein